MQIECLTIMGDKKTVSSEKLVFRPAAYAAVIHDGKILLLRTKSSGKYWFPGGGINIDETLEAGMKREVKEETGIEIEVQKFLDFKEVFFYYKPLDEAYHSFAFFYLCRPKKLDLVKDEDVNDGESEKPRWVDIETISKDDLQVGAQEIFQLVCQNNK